MDAEDEATGASQAVPVHTDGGDASAAADAPGAYTTATQADASQGQAAEATTAAETAAQVSELRGVVDMLQACVDSHAQQLGTMAAAATVHAAAAATAGIQGQLAPDGVEVVSYIYALSPSSASVSSSDPALAKLAHELVKQGLYLQRLYGDIGELSKNMDAIHSQLQRNIHLGDSVTLVNHHHLSTSTTDTVTLPGDVTAASSFSLEAQLVALWSSLLPFQEEVARDHKLLMDSMQGVVEKLQALHIRIHEMEAGTPAT